MEKMHHGQKTSQRHRRPKNHRRHRIADITDGTDYGTGNQHHRRQSIEGEPRGGKQPDVKLGRFPQSTPYQRSVARSIRERDEDEGRENA